VPVGSGKQTASSTSTHPLGFELGDLLVGKVVDQRYRVLGRIGQGGMADVFEVEHVALGRRLAMKVLRHRANENARLVRRFRREAMAASRLETEHVVRIVDYGLLAEGFPYFVMDLLRGQNLRNLLDAEPCLPSTRVANLAIDVCLGLHRAHGAGLVHRDLKPENLWLSRGDDGREICILLDFGVARVEGAHTTGDGALVGTVRYMSPEQIGSGEPGPASDLFSLAVIMYECLSGASPFAADSLERTLYRILNETPTQVHERNPDVPRHLSELISTCLAKRPEDRPGSARQLAHALRSFAGSVRVLPSFEGEVPRALGANTLAEDEPLEIQVARITDDVASVLPAKRSVAGAWLFGTAVGLVAGGASVWALGDRAVAAETPQHPSTTPVSRAPQSEDASLRALAPAAPPPVSGAASLSPVATSSAPSVVLPRRVVPTPRASDATPAASTPRPRPPTPDFDGRNPYTQ
jgi:serine/threonine-protein kinase